MKYPCGLIQDLLPLYIDGVCSDESKAAIEQHLPECSSCKEYYSTMCEADNMVIDTHIEDRERQKAASLQAVKKKLLKKQIIIAMAAVVALVVIAFSVVGVLQNITEIVEYDDNISVSMVDGDLVGRLQGSQEVYVRIKQITNTVDGQEKNICFSAYLIRNGMTSQQVQICFQNTHYALPIKVQIPFNRFTTIQEIILV